MDEESAKPLPDLLIRTTGKGKSVFASRDFPIGEFIIEFRGKLYNREEYLKKVNPKNNHFLQIDTNLYLGPTRTADNYINHCCDPNAGMVIRSGKAMLFAIRPIARGEEITFDYSTSMDEDYWEMDCNCESIHCRKRVRDFKYLPESTREHYINLGIVPQFVINSVPEQRTSEPFIIEINHNIAYATPAAMAAPHKTQ